MTLAARIVYALALVVGLSAGAIFGFWWDADLLKSYYTARRVTAPRELDDFSFMQYRHADVGHARTALLASTGFQEQLEALSPDKGQSFHLAAIYTRLALLEEVANNARTSHDYMAKAKYWCAMGGGQHCSDLEMKATLRNLDERLERLGIR
jgi:hypothetical protein